MPSYSTLCTLFTKHQRGPFISLLKKSTLTGRVSSLSASKAACSSRTPINKAVGSLELAVSTTTALPQLQCVPSASKTLKAMQRRATNRFVDVQPQSSYFHRTFPNSLVRLSQTAADECRRFNSSSRIPFKSNVCTNEESAGSDSSSEREKQSSQSRTIFNDINLQAKLFIITGVSLFSVGVVWSFMMANNMTLSELVSMADQQLEGYADHIEKSIGGIISKLMGGSPSVLLPPAKELGFQEGFPTLVINFDEVICKMEHSRVHGWRVIRRPGANRLFRELLSHYEFVIWSDDVFPVAQDVCAKWGLPVSGCLHREQCEKRGNHFVKDLSRLGRPLNRVIMLDHSKEAFGDHSENGIVVSKFNGDPTDNELDKLVDFLKVAATSDKDLRSTIEEYGGGCDGKLVSRFAHDQEINSKKRDTQRARGHALGISSVVSKGILPTVSEVKA